MHLSLILFLIKCTAQILKYMHGEDFPEMAEETDYLIRRVRDPGEPLTLEHRIKAEK